MLYSNDVRGNRFDVEYVFGIIVLHTEVWYNLYHTSVCRIICSRQLQYSAPETFPCRGSGFGPDQASHADAGCIVVAMIITMCSTVMRFGALYKYRAVLQSHFVPIVIFYDES